MSRQPRTERNGERPQTVGGRGIRPFGVWMDTVSRRQEARAALFVRVWECRVVAQW